MYREALLIGCFGVFGNETLCKKADDEYAWQAVVESYNTQRERSKVIIHSESKRIIAYHQNNIESVVAFGKEENIVATVGRFISITAESQKQQ